MTNAIKDEQIRDFREIKDILVTTEIGGEGRNLQFCHQMVNYDLPWNPMKIEQRIGRIHRIGQENEVRIYNMCAKGSIEDYILEILDRKINMFEMVIGEIDMVIGRVRGEKDFADRVYDIWQQAASATERKQGFAKLATQLKRSKTQYKTTQELDEKLFGENYEL
jgi:SNF2 family DNA or RNA helicase